MKPSGAIFLEQTQSRGLGAEVKTSEAATRVEGAPTPTGCAPLPHGPLERPPTNFFHLYKSIYPKNIEYQDRSGVPPPQASVATKTSR